MIGLLMMIAAPVSVAIGPPAPCEIAVDNVTVAADALGPVLKNARRRTARAKVTYSPDVPWRCLGETETALARARFRKVAYDPPLPSDGR